ncbi:sensor histidine kinase [Polaribacter sargassicola]|uniref:sensor histidine kinase n=1 Tax=Polaribacter sargassicola TaxID=2836891 RepID=UPI001F34C4C1|nr:sensor histidine kinase [Polaribacter sp. DS7-9]MCG1036633.1 sensor histidine kinase [Polaribacter sp. DS7-9]
MLKYIFLKSQKIKILIFLISCISYSQTSKLDSAYFYFANAQKFEKNNKLSEAYRDYLKAKRIYETLFEYDSISKCNLELFNLLDSQKNLDKDAKFYLDDYYNYGLKKNDTLMLLKASNSYASYFWNSDSIERSRNHYKESLRLTNKSELKKYKVTIYANLAYLYTKSKPDSANYYYEKTLKNSDQLNKTQLLGTYINYAIHLKNQEKYIEAINQLKLAEKIEIDAFHLKFNKIIYRNLANYYKLSKNYKEAYQYFEKYNLVKDSINITAQNIAISDLNIKYETEKKDKLNLQLEIDKEKSQNFLIATLLTLILISVIGTLFIKNSNKKRKVAEQQKELEKQKNLTLLKEQELTTINAIINGQEKERKQIAEDLHDNLGSILATLKLHFDNLKINHTKKKIDQEILFNKTEGLINEAYLKVRSIAHAKNAGVIANQGLLVAIKMMAEKISSADKIKIDVVDFGLNKRLENSLEIGVFRIVQELTTNIIKHADAKNATINLSFYDQNLNIIIEDNGKGFDINNVNLKNGMGISSIKTRIEHLNGTFEIDSTIGKGSSVIIDIPIK